MIIINSPLIPAELPQPRVTYTTDAAEFIGTRRTLLASIGQSWYRSLPGRDYSSGSPILQQTTSRQALAFSTSVLERALPGMPRIYQPIGTVSYNFLPSDNSHEFT